jgi:hypothetical protein
MPDQMYPQPDEADQPEAGPNGDESQDASEEKGEGDASMEGETALLPKSILGGKDFQPGEEVVLKIVGMHDDEVEVSYAPEKAEPSSDDEADGNTGSQMDQAQSKLSSMGSGY